MPSLFDHLNHNLRDDSVNLAHANSKKQGDVGMGIAIGWFAEKGYTVSVPLTDSQDYDLVVDVADQLCRVQVRTTKYQRNGNYTVNLKVSGGNRSGTGKTKPFDPSRVELLFVLTASGTRYLIPSEEVKAKNALALSAQMTRFIV